jgi:hypothetical protein
VAEVEHRDVQVLARIAEHLVQGSRQAAANAPQHEQCGGQAGHDGVR